MRDRDPNVVAGRPVTAVGELYNVDVFTLAWSVRYPEASTESRDFNVEGVRVPAASICHLIASKRTGRLQDAADIEMLEENRASNWRTSTRLTIHLCQAIALCIVAEHARGQKQEQLRLRFTLDPVARTTANQRKIGEGTGYLRLSSRSGPSGHPARSSGHRATPALVKPGEPLEYLLVVSWANWFSIRMQYVQI